MIEKAVTSGDCQSLTFLSELLSIKEMKKYLIKVDIPTNVDILPYKEQISEKPSTVKFVCRNLLKHCELDEERRNQLREDKTAYENWKASQKNEFGIRSRSDEEYEKVILIISDLFNQSYLYQEFKIQAKILESRRKKVHKESHDERFEKTSALDLKKIAEEIENSLNANKNDKLAETNTPLNGSGKKKEKKEKLQTEPSKVLYRIWNQ